MKMLLIVICLLSSACSAVINAFEWSAETERPEPFRATVMSGETVELSAALTKSGQRIQLEPGTDVTFLWQTNGMSDVWWSKPGTLSTNGAMSVTWLPNMQPSATGLVQFYFGATAPGAWTIRNWPKAR